MASQFVSLTIRNSGRRDPMGFDNSNSLDGSSQATGQREESLNLSRSARTTLSLVVLVISAAVGLFISEFLVRKFSPRQIRTPIVEYVNGLASLRPNSRARLYVPGSFDTVQTIGPQRFRGARSYSPRPARGTIRIAALGDSFTFGDGVNDDETYPVVLERNLHERNWPVEVINAGVPGRGTGEEALYYDEYVSDFHPNIVILGVVGNDPDDDVDRRLFRRDSKGAAIPVPPPDRPPAPRPRTNAVLTWLYSHSALFWAARMGLTTATDVIAGGRRPGVDLNLTQDEIRWLARRISGRGAQLVVVYLPWCAPDPSAHGPCEQMQRDEAELATAAGAAARSVNAPFLDLRDFAANASGSYRASLYHVGGDKHPAAAGAKAFAEGIADFLASSGVLASARVASQ